MNEFDYGVVADFLSENWAVFVQFAAHAGVNEAACEKVIQGLERMAGRA